MTQLSRIETFLFRAIWLILWVYVKRGWLEEDRVMRWRHDYYAAGGGSIEHPHS